MNNPFTSGLDKIPVSAFDHYFLNDDTDDYPGIFYTRVTLRGLFNHEQFEDAVNKALQRAILLRSVIEGDVHGKRKNIYWKPASHQPFIQWVKNAELYVYPHSNTTGFDLTKEYGFRLFLRESQQQTVLLLQTHHSCVDATGARMFLEDILAYYDQQLSGETHQAAKLRTLSQDSLLRRDDFHQTPSSLRKRWFKDFKYVLRNISFQPRAFYSDATAAGTKPIELPLSAWHEFSAEEFKTIKNASKKLNGTINDFLLWCLFLSLDEWNRTHRPKGKSLPIRIGMAINLRQKPDDDVIPPANVLSMYFLDRKGGILGKPKKLFASIQKETQYVKQNQMGLTFIRFSRLLGNIKGGIQQMLKPKPLLSKCLVTANLSNLGLPFADSPLLNANGKVQAADMIVERIELMPPFRHYTHGSFGIASYDGRMVITFHFDSHALTQQQGEELLGVLVSNITRNTA